MTITVTKEDIEHGRHCDPDCCPIGRALSRAGVTHFGVAGSAVMVADGPTAAHGLPLPPEVEHWILQFDGKQEVQPISFDLPVSAMALPSTKSGRPRMQRLA